MGFLLPDGGGDAKSPGPAPYTQDGALAVNRKSRIVLVEDHAVLRQSLRAVLSREPDLEVVAEAQDGLEGLGVIQDTLPDLVLLDIRMPKMDGTSILREISRVSPRSRVLVLTMHDNEDFVLDAFRNGANGYILKTVPCDELIHAIRAVLRGNAYVSPEISVQIEKDGPRKECEQIRSSLSLLTKREREVLKLVAEGNSSKTIASLLSISERTVNNHRANLMHKLDLHSATALTVYAVEQGLVGSSWTGQRA